MFCCSDTNGQSITKLQPPQFPTASNEPRPCVDHSTHCKRWAKNYPESCSPGHNSYIFMREACQSSCKRCGDSVSFISFVSHKKSYLKFNIQASLAESF
jgi:hypothetical protein